MTAHHSDPNADTLLDDLARAVQLRMDLTGASLRQVARETGMSVSTVSRFLAGSTITLDGTCALARWVGRSIRLTDPERISKESKG